jgi:hypothetical protein
MTEYGAGPKSEEGFSTKQIASEDFRKAVQNIENQVDALPKTLPIVRRPKNLAIWALLTQGYLHLTGRAQPFEMGTPQQTVYTANMSRIVATAINWVWTYAPAVWISNQQLQTDNDLMRDAQDAVEVSGEFAAFTATMPAWHKGRLLAELIDEVCVRFIPDNFDTVERRVRAYQHGIRPKGKHKAPRDDLAMEPHLKEQIDRKFEGIMSQFGAARLAYSKPTNLWRLLHQGYLELLKKTFRRGAQLVLGDFTLGQFCQVHAAILAICGTHEGLLQRWTQQRGNPPLNDVLLIYQKNEWVRHISRLAQTDFVTTDAIISDLTFGATRVQSLFVHPFVPLDRDQAVLGVLPLFPMSSNADENILRVCSELRRDKYDLLTELKEGEMNDEIVAGCSSFHCRCRCSLPVPLPDVDLLIEDITNKTVLIAELKYLRHALSVSENLNREKDFRKAVTQLYSIRKFLTANPDYLYKNGYMSRRLDEVNRVQYAVIARDYFVWLDPKGEFPVIADEPFREMLGKTTDLGVGLDLLLTFDWLPVEGEDFDIKWHRATVNGVSVEHVLVQPL